MIALKPNPERAVAYYSAGQWRDQTILEAVAARINSTPGKIAIRDASGGHATFAELDALSSRLAGYLRANGFETGDVLTMHLPNWWQSAVFMLATYKLGGVMHVAPPTLGWKDLAYVIGRCRSKAIVCAGRFRNVDYTQNLDNIRGEQGLPRICLTIGSGAVQLGTPLERALEADPVSAAVRSDPDMPAAIMFTSGTESRPKGVVHTHNTILFSEREFGARLGLTADDVCFLATPISHATGLMHGLVLNLMLGCTLSLLDIFEGHRAVELMRGDGATWTVGATPFLHDTINALMVSASRLPSLKFFVCGGAPLPEAIVRMASKASIRVLPLYGSTESPPHALTRPDAPLEQSWKSDGEALPGIEIRVVGQDGRHLPFGVEGEEISRGPNLFIGYLDEPEMTARAVDADGWYHSGDLAIVHPDNTLKISGRIKDIIIRGGQNISAREVEDVLMEHPAVREAALVGRPHERLGETGVAVVVTKVGQSVSLQELTQFLTARGVSRYKLPEELLIWPELPRTPSGKIRKFLIREHLQRLDDQDD